MVSPALEDVLTILTAKYGHETRAGVAKQQQYENIYIYFNWMQMFSRGDKITDTS